MADLTLECPDCGKLNSIPVDHPGDTCTCVDCQGEFSIDTAVTVQGEAVPDYLVGEVVSDCKVLEKVGEGGFGTVYKALDQNLQRSVALKVMLQSLTSNAEFVQKFIREAVTAAQLNHPNIVGIHKVGRDERRGIHYLIMEFVAGRTLSDVVKEKGVLTIEDILPIMLQSCDALATAHEANIVHRDIKPENLMVDQAGQIKITDFGLAKSLTSDSNTTKVMGTPHYMSPEQFEGKPVDGRSDIYSLGVTFYFLLSKNRPYEGQNTVQIIYSILTQDPKPLTDLNTKVPRPMWQIIEKMIAKKAEDRYQTLRETITDVRSFQERHGASRMSCPGCGARNPRGRKFCRSCGAPLLVRCPSCGNLEPVGTSACGSCHADIDSLLKVNKALESGKRFKALGDLRRAAEAFGRVLELDNVHNEARAELDELGVTLEEVDRVKTEAEELLQTGEIEEALRRVEDLLGRYPTASEVREHRDQLRRELSARRVDALRERAEKMVMDGDVRGGIELLDQALRVDGSRRDVRERKQELQQKISAIATSRQNAAQALAAGRYADALALATDVLKLDPDDTAMQEVRRKAQSSVESVDEFITRGKEALERNDLAAALSEFETALSVNAGDPQIYQLVESTRHRITEQREKIALCRRLIAEHEYDQAQRGLNEVLEESPDHAEAKALLTEAEKGLRDAKREAEIETALKQAARLREDGDFSGALEKFKRVLKLDARNAAARTGREEVEAKIREERDLGELVGEHLANGRFDQAVAAYGRLKDANPARQAEIDADIAKAQRSAKQVQASLGRAEEALSRREYRRASQAAADVLELASRHPGAVAIKKDADKALSAIDRFLGECDRLILSELFDEALELLDKAKERGATQEEYKHRWQSCQQGRLALLKADATRSLVLNNFEAAIAAYEQVLEVSGEDSDALEGKRSAERRLVILTTEPLSLRMGAAAVLLLLMLLMNVTAVASTQSADVTARLIENREEERSRAAIVEERKDVDPEPGAAIAAERAGTDAAAFKAAAQLWAEQANKFDKHPDAAWLRTGRSYCDQVAAALEAATPQQRLDTLPGDELFGEQPELAEDRRQQVEKLSSDFVAQWFAQARQNEKTDEGQALADYRAILEHPVARNAPEARTIGARTDFLEQLDFGRDELDNKNFKGAALAFTAALEEAEAAQVPERVQKLKERLEEVGREWTTDLTSKAEALGKGPEAEQEYYDTVIGGLVDMREALDLSDAELKQAIQKVQGR